VKEEEVPMEPIGAASSPQGSYATPAESRPKLEDLMVLTPGGGGFEGHSMRNVRIS
jgi:hypothetical protein